MTTDTISVSVFYFSIVTGLICHIGRSLCHICRSICALQRAIKESWDMTINIISVSVLYFQAIAMSAYMCLSIFHFYLSLFSYLKVYFCTCLILFGRINTISVSVLYFHTSLLSYR